LFLGGLVEVIHRYINQIANIAVIVIVIVIVIVLIPLDTRRPNRQCIRILL